MYVKPEVRKGLLGRMLTELLDTRVMVKQAMKRVRDNKVRVTELEILQKTKCSLGTDQNPRCAPIRAEVHSQCHIRIHKRNILGKDACSGNRR
jgi:hypothetical protein